MKDNIKEREIINKISTVGISGNIALTAFKLFAGIIGHSGAMVSDAIHSLSDVAATLIALIGVKISQKLPDREHPYGHERMECLASVLLAVILLITGISIGLAGINNLVTGEYLHSAAPGVIALIAAIVSIAVKEGMFWYTRHYAKILNSSAFMADAWHHRSDAMSSVGSLIGIGGAMMGIRALDSVASIVICVCIGKVSLDIFRDALNKLLDTSCSESYEKELESYIASRDGVEHLDMLRTRMFGNKIYIDTEIAVKGNLSLKEAHLIAENVHCGVEQNFNNVKHIMIHVNPAE